MNELTKDGYYYLILDMIKDEDYFDPDFEEQLVLCKMMDIVEAG
jgi:hypothetical protein